MSVEKVRKCDGRTMTLNLPDTEMELLEALAEKRGTNKSAICRQAIKLIVECEGKNVYVESPEGTRLLIFL